MSGCVLIWSFGAGHPLLARNDGETIIQKVGPEDGLTDSTVYGIYQDPVGYLWLATQNGLNRYDGMSIKAFQHSVSEINTLSDNSVSTIHGDRDGVLWLGTWGGGVNHFDPVTEDFVRYTNRPGDGNSLSDNRVQAVYRDRDGIVWIGTRSQGLNRLDPETGRFEHYRHDPQNPESLSNDRVWEIIEDDRGKLWVATADGLNRMEEPGRFTRFHADPDNPHSFKDNQTRILMLDRGGNLWIGTESGVALMDPRTGAFIPYLERLKPLPFKDEVITALFEDREGRVWLGTREKGLFVISEEGGELILRRFSHDPADPNSLSQNDIRCVFQDRSGIHWVGTRHGGLNKIDIRPKKFRLYRLNQGLDSDLMDNRINAFTEDHRGVLWAGAVGGLFRYDTPDSEPVIYRGGGPEGLSSSQVHTLHTDHAGRIWVGTFAGGLNRYDFENDRFDTWRYDPDNPDTISSNYIRIILEDSARRLWIGTAIAGLNLFDRNSGRAIRYQNKPNVPTSLHENRINTLIEGREGFIWVGAYENGISKFNPATGKSVHYRAKTGDPTGLNSGNILSFYQDPAGALWIGARHGLNVLRDPSQSPEDAVFSHYTVEDGLPNDVVNAILGDSKGFLWLSTDKGLSRFDPATGGFLNFQVHDGLQGGGFNLSAGYRSRSGTFYFGGNRGFNSFVPGEVSLDPYVAPIVITTFKKYNREVAFDRRVSDVEEIELSWRDDVFSFEFAALDYTAPERHLFAYKLEGFNQDWIYQGTENDVTYTNMDAGVFTLHVKGTNSDGVWNEEGASVVLRVVPAPWRTWWAYVIYLALIAAVVAAYMESQRRKLAHAGWVNDQLRHVDKLKDEFLTNTSHELRTPLNGIIGLVESLLDGIAGALPEKAVSNLNLVLVSGRRLAGLVDNILDFAKLRDHTLQMHLVPVDLHDVAEEILTLSKPLADTKKLKLINAVPKDLTAVMADENRLLQIFHNLVGNGIKFTSEGLVRIGAELNGDHVVVRVEDTGEGIPKDQFERIFESFHQVDDSTARVHAGTGLGLTITRQLVDLHQGKLWVDSQPGHGSTFFFTLGAAKEKARPRESAAKSRRFQPAPGRPTALADTDQVMLSPERADNSGRRILIVDDEEVNRKVLINHLTLRNFKIVEAAGGKEALRLFKAGAACDLVLLDIMMPHVSGYEVCAKLRERFSVQELPIIFLTAKDRIPDLVKGFEVGANDYLSKPVDKEELLARISLHLNVLDKNRDLERRVAVRTRELEMKNAELKLFEDIIKTINQNMDLSMVLQAMLEQTCVLFPVAEKGGFVLWDRAQERYRFEASVGFKPAEIKLMTPLFEDFIGATIIKGTTIAKGIVIVPHIDQIELPEINGLTTPKTMLVMEVILVGKLAGFLILVNMSDPTAFNRADGLSLGRLREHAVAALAKARNFQELKKKNREVERRTRELEQKNEELEEAYRELEVVSLTDPLTGLNNRRYLLKYIDKDISKIHREFDNWSKNRRETRPEELDIVFILVDMDKFKSVNDTYGHDAGDLVLQQTAKILGKVCRQSDFLVRWGGEEFLIACRYMRREDAPVMAGRIRKMVREHDFEIGDGQTIRKTASVGFACYPFLPGIPGALTWEQVVTVADLSLYAAKHTSRDAWVGLSAGENAEDCIYQTIRDDLVGALHRGELVVQSSLPEGSDLTWS